MMRKTIWLTEIQVDPQAKEKGDGRKEDERDPRLASVERTPGGMFFLSLWKTTESEEQLA